TGLERGGIAANIYNYGDATVTVAYLEAVPWFLRLYLHTLSIETEALDRKDGNATRSSSMPATSLVSLRHQPAVDRTRPAVLEAVLRVPPHSMAAVTVDFDRAFVKYTEHPPDANRGFDIGPAVLTVLDAAGASPDLARMAREAYPSPPRLWGETLLIALPAPDFSMPYNVVTMTCTVMALFF
ncbi:hypothetical protein HK405_014972, partial [Cladochytrium tenue]